MAGGYNTECTSLKYFRENGFLIHDSFYGLQENEILLTALITGGAFDFTKAHSTDNFLLRIRELQELAYSEKIMDFGSNILGNSIKPIDAFILDKTLRSNWELNWHQDLKLRVKNRSDLPGYSNWSLEAGIWHAVPPVSVLTQLLIMRIHLDECNNRNGAIMVIPGSHRLGIIGDRNIPEIVKTKEIYHCEVNAGGAMFMSPLLLHKSPRSLSHQPRRTLQIIYMPAELNDLL